VGNTSARKGRSHDQVRGYNADHEGSPMAVLPFKLKSPLPKNITPGPRITAQQQQALNQPVTIDKAIDYANSYAYLTIDRTLEATELAFVASLHPPRPPTKQSVLDTMDVAYHSLSAQ
jgi:hypothetical protein